MGFRAPMGVAPRRRRRPEPETIATATVVVAAVAYVLALASGVILPDNLDRRFFPQQHWYEYWHNRVRGLEAKIESTNRHLTRALIDLEQLRRTGDLLIARNLSYAMQTKPDPARATKRAVELTAAEWQATTWLVGHLTEQMSALRSELATAEAELAKLQQSGVPPLPRHLALVRKAIPWVVVSPLLLLVFAGAGLIASPILSALIEWASGRGK